MGLEQVFYTVSGLSEGRWYHWRVRACVEGTCSAWSSVWRWMVGEEGPASAGRARRYYYVRDHLGSVRATVDEAGAMVHHDDYYPFGARMPGRSYVSGEPTKENFTGHELDDETGLLYAGARYYDPVIARWTSVDPLAEKHPEWTPYNYVLDNPLLLIDPDGRQEAYYNINRENRLLNPATRAQARKELQELRPVGEALIGIVSDPADIALTATDAYEHGLSWRHGIALLPLVSFGMMRAGDNILEAAGDAARAADGVSTATRQEDALGDLLNQSSFDRILRSKGKEIQFTNSGSAEEAFSGLRDVLGVDAKDVKIKGNTSIFRSGNRTYTLRGDSRGTYTISVKTKDNEQQILIRFDNE